jgi:hypothetical protein
VSPEQAQQELERKRAAVPAAMAHGRRAVAEEALRLIRAEWPVGKHSGEHSIDQWRYDESSGRLVNDAPWAQHVHDGLADRLVPEILQRLQPLYREAVTRYLDEVH